MYIITSCYINHSFFQEHKKEIIPSEVEYEDAEAKIGMEELLKNTVDRYMTIEKISSKFQNLKDQKVDGEDLHVNLIFKYGLDGTGDQKKYKQKGVDCDSLLASQMCPIRFVERETKEVIFTNPLANCSCSHRPVRLSYEHEDRESVDEEYQRMKTQIEEMLPYSPREGITIYWVGIPTLADGKTLTFVCDEAAHSSCPLCGGKEKAISTKGKRFKVKTHVKGKAVNVLLHGLSPTHNWMRSTTFILNLGCYSRIKKPKVQTQDDKDSRAQRQNEIASRIKEELNLTVFGKGPHGGGVLDGNTSRILFEHAELLSEVCEVPLDLILVLRKLCRGAASSRPIDPEKWKRAAEEFEEIYFDKFMSHDKVTAWYFLPSTVHKQVKHGHEIIAALPVPPGLAGEEGAEAQNKHFRSIRKNLTCKKSAKRTLQDLFERLLAKSDPVMNEYVAEKVSRKKKTNEIPDDLRDLLTDEYLQSIENEEAIESDNEETDEDDDDEEEDDDEDDDEEEVYDDDDNGEEDDD